MYTHVTCLVEQRTHLCYILRWYPTFVEKEKLAADLSQGVRARGHDCIDRPQASSKVKLCNQTRITLKAGNLNRNKDCFD